ncbi:MAG TPA: response regulator transcription factor [Candidatus Corynebacterium gallistercoris]|uniref:Response regulator transcription factor n=1 Tax=Candidatus Corynebacterium gallistercoris TaxID=2838530 RepID=A0A9D1RXI5_9CORY|nr:response regulator transcription factor [Candidatus Corynebacterium gallistercoris]
MPIRVLLVDDDPSVLTALTYYFAAAQGIEIAGQADNGRTALEALRRDDPHVDVVLADIHMPEMGGVELLENLETLAQPPAFVAMTSMDTDETMLEILSRGGSGYIIKSSRPQRFIAAVEDAVSGGTAVSSECLSRLVDYIPHGQEGADAQRERRRWMKAGATAPEPLSNGEKEVLRHLVQGLSNKEICKATMYAESTVKKHVSSLMVKFDAHSRLKLATEAIRAGW